MSRETTIIGERVGEEKPRSKAPIFSDRSRAGQSPRGELSDLIKMLKRDAEEGPYDPVGDYQAEPKKDVADLTQLAGQEAVYANAPGSTAGGAERGAKR